MVKQNCRSKKVTYGFLVIVFLFFGIFVLFWTFIKIKIRIIFKSCYKNFNNNFLNIFDILEFFQSFGNFSERFVSQKIQILLAINLAAGSL